MDKFQRNYVLSIDDSTLLNTLVIRPPYSIEFDVVKNAGSSVCSATINIYNLNPSTRDALYQDFINPELSRSVEFKAGYGPEVSLPLIFKGKVAKCYSYRNGVNFITTVEIYDDMLEVINNYSSQTIKAGSTVEQAINALVDDIPTVKKGVISKFGGVFTRGAALHGNTISLIKELTNDSFFIDNGEAHVLKDDEALLGVVNKISSKSGLIGSPRRENSILTFDMIFEPRLKMNQLIEIESETVDCFNGQFRVSAFHHRGVISDVVAGQAITTVQLNHSLFLKVVVR